MYNIAGGGGCGTCVCCHAEIDENHRDVYQEAAVKLSANDFVRLCDP
jgi:hypothetical protein